MTKTAWQNRIIGFGTKPADQFQANARNWRRHPTSQQETMRKALNKIGWIGVVIENVQTGELIDGHERIWEALDNNNAEVPFIQVDLTPAEQDIALATFDTIGHMAVTDENMLAELLNDIKAQDVGLAELVAELAEEMGVTLEGDEPPGDPGAQLDKAEELRIKWQTARGHVWQIGKHRLICGDSTSRDDVERLMDGAKAQFVFTDPPYGVEYTGGTKKWAALKNDDVTDMYGATLPLIYESTDTKAAVYLAFASAKARDVYNAIFAAKYEQRALIIWNKNHAQFGAMGSQYKQKHEPVAYLFKRGSAPYWYGPDNEVTVWDIDRAVANEFYPTQKPPALVVRAMTNSAPVDGLCLDLFLGSGTTMVAAEQTGRTCYGMELEPKYVAVTLERLSLMGLEPKLVATL